MLLGLAVLALLGSYEPLLIATVGLVVDGCRDDGGCRDRLDRGGGGGGGGNT